MNMKFNPLLNVELPMIWTFFFAQLSMKFFLLINIKMLINVYWNIKFMLNIWAEHEKKIFITLAPE